MNSLAEEFSEPFDLDRYMSGDQAMVIGCNGKPYIRQFSHIEEDCLASICGALVTIRGAQSEYKMRPFDAWVEVKGKAPFEAGPNEWEYEGPAGVVTAAYPTNASYTWEEMYRARRIPKKVEDKWIPWSGGECPIPWAKAGEYALKYAEGSCSGRQLEPATRMFSVNTKPIAFRLTNGWIHCDGKAIPEGIKGAKTGEWELRFRDGTTTDQLAAANNISRDTWKNGIWGPERDVVAVRWLKDRPEEQTEKTSLINIPGSTPEFIRTGKQIIDSAALNRFQSSNRGKEFRAQIGKAVSEPYVGLRDGEMEEIAGRALSEMKPWWRK